MDKKEFKKYLKQAKKGDKDAMAWVGVCLYRGDGVKKDLGDAAYWLKKAEENGYYLSWTDFFQEAMATLGLMYYNGEAVQKDEKKAKELWEETAKYTECHGGALAKEYLETYFPAKKPEAAKKPEPEKKPGANPDDSLNAKQLYDKASDYEHGKNGVQKDIQKAIYYYEKASQTNTKEHYFRSYCAMSAYSIAEIYYKGEGVERDYKKAFYWYQKAADLDHGTAPYDIGICYYYGRGVDKNLQKAKYYMERASRNHVTAANTFLKERFNTVTETAKQDAFNETPEGKYKIGWNYYYGKNGVDKDYRLAVMYFREAADKGHAQAQYMLGWCYYCGEGIEKNIYKAVNWFQKAADKNVAGAQNWLGYCYFKGYGVTKNEAKAKELLQKASANGSAEAKKRLVEFFSPKPAPKKTATPAAKPVTPNAPEKKMSAEEQYEKGLSCAKAGDYENAAIWYEKAAERGHRGAQTNLGFCYSQGRGVSQNYEKAVYWYERAADYDEVAQFNLGSCYYDGTGVEKDLEHATLWYHRSATNGYMDAQYVLGCCYSKGEGVQKDFERAHYWWTKAAEQGDSDAQFKLAVLYANGMGVSQSYDKMIYWLEKAAAQGHEDAIHYLKINKK